MPVDHPLSMAFVHYLTREGAWSAVVGIGSLAALPLSLAAVAAGEELTPGDVIGIVPVVAIVVRGLCLRRAARATTARSSGGLTVRETATVRRRLVALLTIVVAIGVLPGDWIVPQVILGVLGTLYGTGVLLRARRASRRARGAQDRKSMSRRRSAAPRAIRSIR